MSRGWPCIDWRFAPLLTGGIAASGMLAALLIAATGEPLPQGAFWIGGFLGGGTLLRLIGPALLIWFVAGTVVRRRLMAPAPALLIATSAIAAVGWLILAHMTTAVFGPQIWENPGSLSAMALSATAAAITAPVLGARIYRNHIGCGNIIE